MSKFTQFFEDIWNTYESACQNNYQSETFYLTLGRSSIRLTFATAEMLPNILPSLAHILIPEPTNVDLDIGIWDSMSTGIPMNPPPWENSDYIARGEIKGADAQSDIEIAYHPGSGVLSMLHTTQHKAIVWIRDASEYPYYEKAAPLRTIFHWWTTQQGQQFVHGAAIGIASGAVLLTGKGGSGKSTTALSGLLSGMLYLGDDYVLCGLVKDQTMIYSVYNSAKLNDQSVRLLPQLAYRITRNHSSEKDKHVFLAYEHFPHLVYHSLPLRAILIPKVTPNTETQLHSIKSSLAFLALAPTTVFQLAGAREASVSFLRSLVMRLPCYQLLLGKDMTQSPTIITSLLKSLE